VGIHVSVRIRERDTKADPSSIYRVAGREQDIFDNDVGSAFAVFTINDGLIGEIRSDFVYRVRYSG
jgi:hypothetical protein